MNATSSTKRAFCSLLDKADLVSFNNEEVCSRFLEDYRQYDLDLTAKTEILRLPLGIFETIWQREKLFNRPHICAKFGINPELPVVMLGTNGRDSQQQVTMAQLIASSEKQFSPRATYIFPVSSGSSTSKIQRLKAIVQHSSLSCVFIEHFVTDEELADLRLLTDVLVQVQERDQFSGAMQEAMLAGSLVITGSWLPYRVFDDSGACLRKIGVIDELPDSLLKALDELHDASDERLVNRDVVTLLSSPSTTSNLWAECYRRILSSKFGTT